MFLNCRDVTCNVSTSFFQPIVKLLYNSGSLDTFIQVGNNTMTVKQCKTATMCGTLYYQVLFSVTIIGSC
jgi:hypothetical protein